MSIFNVVLFTCSLFVYCGADYGGTLTKCSIRDEKCLKALFVKFQRDASEAGIPEIGIPPSDPMHITNISTTVLDAYKFTLTEGDVTGISSCVYNTLDIDMKRLFIKLDVTCDISIHGEFIATEYSPTLRYILGSNTLDGPAYGKVNLDEFTMRAEIPFIPFKKQDGRIYLNLITEKATNTYEVGKATFFIKNFCIGKKDMSQFVTAFLNENWSSQSGIQTSVKTFIDEYKERFISFYKILLENISINKFIIENLTPYF